MADGFANKYLKDFLISSAGTHPEEVNQNAINAMKKIGIDISNNQSNKIDFNQLNNFDYIITLCGDARDNCLNLSEYKNKHIHWDIEDPALFNGTMMAVKDKYAQTRDIISEKIKDLETQEIKRLNYQKIPKILF